MIGYYVFRFVVLMNKKHWNSVYFNADVPIELLEQQVVNSYDLVVKGLKKSDKEYLNTL